MKNIISHTIALLTAVLLVISCSAQKEAAIWYFGKNAGLDFSNYFPVAITNGSLNTLEGCATICDKNGNLLFYTDGITVYNKEHAVMKNGTGLNGNSSAAQSAIIIPQPGNTSIFYLFTVDQLGGTNGLKYNIIDMQLDGTKGEVIAKNILLHTPSAEKITAVKHYNGKSIWIVSHSSVNDEFLVYELTKTSLNSSPISSKLGVNHVDYLYSRGYIKASPKGDKIAAAITDRNIFEVFDFDTKTGKLSNAQKDPSIITDAYGVEFSPDGSKVYLSTWRGIIYQYDLNEPNLFKSRTLIRNIGHRCWGGAIQAGVDGRLYIACWSNVEQSMDVIHSPNKKALACDYEERGIDLKGKFSQLGLPTFIQTYFGDDSTLKCSFTFEGYCVGDSFKFYPVLNHSTETFFWNFGDGQLQNDTATGDTVYYSYSKGGEYTPKLISSNGEEKCTAKMKIQVVEKPEILLPNDTFFCEGASVLIKPIKYIGNISWDRSIKDTFPSIKVSSVSKLIATAKTECATEIAKDSINISTKLLPKITLPNDTVFCEGNYDSIEPLDFTGKIFWNGTFTDTLPKLPVNKGGVYEATVINTCGNNRDIMRVEYILKPKVILPNDTFYCSSDSVLVTPIKYEGKLVWSTPNGDTIPVIRVKPPIYLTVKAINTCGVDYDSIDITVRDPPKIELSVDSVICSGTPFKAKVITDSLKIDWYDGDTSTIRNFTINKSTVLWAKSSNSCGTYYDSLKVTPKQDIGIYIPNSFSPNGDLLNDSFSIFIDDFAPEKYKLLIYDRWGEKLFKSENYLQSWNGTFKGKAVPVGSYMYMLNLLHCNRIKRYKGNITLIR